MGSEEVGQAYVICATPRCGSWLLADCLNQTGIAGHPHEYFMNHVPFDAARGIPTRENLDSHLAAVRSSGRTPNGVCGVKMHWSQLHHLTGLVDAEPGDTGAVFSRIADAIGPLTLIRLRRVDTMRQALSYHRAMREKTWWRLRGDATPGPPDAGPDCAEVARLERLLHHHDRLWDAALAATDAPVLQLTYEQVAADPPRAVQSCLLALGFPFATARNAAAIRPRLVRQADGQTDLWIHRYLSWCRTHQTERQQEGTR